MHCRLNSLFKNAPVLFGNFESQWIPPEHQKASTPHPHMGASITIFLEAKLWNSKTLLFLIAQSAALRKDNLKDALIKSDWKFTQRQQLVSSRYTLQGMTIKLLIKKG